MNTVCHDLFHLMACVEYNLVHMFNKMRISLHCTHCNITLLSFIYLAGAFMLRLVIYGDMVLEQSFF